MKTLFVSAAVAALSIGAASASTTFGPYTFGAFADTVVDDGGAVFERATTDPFTRNPTTADDALLGFDLASSTISYSGSALSVAFNDVDVVNGVGADLVIFELFSSIEYGDITINGFTQAMNGVSLGFVPVPGSSFSNDVNAAEIDLSDFGYAAGEVISGLTLIVTGSSSEYAAFGAISTGVSEVPLPAAAPLMLAGLGLMGMRKRRQAK